MTIVWYEGEHGLIQEFQLLLTAAVVVVVVVVVEWSFFNDCRGGNPKLGFIITRGFLCGA